MTSVTRLSGRLREQPAVRRAAKIVRRFRPRGEEDSTHPERMVILPFVRGRCLEVGCGYRKTSDQAVAIDLVPKGGRGRHGNVTGRVSQADIGADGSCLPFRDGAFDSLIARHNLEHYVDTAATLEEWRRVLAPGGTLAVILPDEEAYPGRTVALDPTHFHGYSPAALAHLVAVVGGFVDIETRPAVAEWSFLLTARRNGD